MSDFLAQISILLFCLGYLYFSILLELLNFSIFLLDCFEKISISFGNSFPRLLNQPQLLLITFRQGLNFFTLLISILILKVTDLFFKGKFISDQDII